MLKLRLLNLGSKIFLPSCTWNRQIVHTTTHKPILLLFFKKLICLEKKCCIPWNHQIHKGRGSSKTSCGPSLIFVGQIFIWCRAPIQTIFVRDIVTSKKGVIFSLHLKHFHVGDTDCSTPAWCPAHMAVCGYKDRQKQGFDLMQEVSHSVTSL